MSACINERIVLRCQPNHYIIVSTAEWQTADSVPGLPGCITDHLPVTGDYNLLWALMPNSIKLILYKNNVPTFSFSDRPLTDINDNIFFTNKCQKMD